MMARARQVPGSTPLFDTLLSLCASADDPVSAGRHKVWGSRTTFTPPQTSTIASHLPKAVGLAFALPRAQRLGVTSGLPRDSVVCCSFGDASVNHATALAGINAARYAVRRDSPTPILFVCEDNQIGISVDAPRRWIGDFFEGLAHLRYFEADGDVEQVWETAELALRTCRTLRAPVFLHLRCVRLWGHAGTDVETAYRSLEEIEGIEALDPLLQNAGLLIETGAAEPRELQALVLDTRERVAAAAVEAARRPKLTTLSEIIAPQAPYDEARCRKAATRAIDPERRQALFGEALPEEARSPGRRTLAAQINAALADEMLRDRSVITFGEDVGRKGGVYGVTQRLQERFGKARVFDTLLDETTILGVAQGAAHVGLLPVPEICYLAYVHNALDQIRGEACSLSFFSAGHYTNPMVVRIAGLGYQKGFGGHFHNDDSIGALRDIPGLMICVPARGADAARLLRACLAIARECGRVIVFLEPIALYHERDLYTAGDGDWLSDYPAPDGDPESALLPGDVGVHGEENDGLLIVSYANGLRLSLRAARRLEQEHGVAARVLDLRWLAPLPVEEIRAHAEACGRVLVVDECRRTGGGVADAIVSELVQTGYEGKLRGLCSADSYVPIGPAAELVLVSEDGIVGAALELMV
jgi:2-oxoisovalerate dehydrogenase E1 component